MVRIIIFLFSICLIGLPVFAQNIDDDDEGDSYIIAVGMSSPQGPDFFERYWKTGYHFMAGFGLAASPSVDVIPKFEYHSLGFKTGKYHADPVSMIVFGVDLRPAALVRGTGRMFLIGGLGIARVETPDIIGPGELARAGELQSNLYINFGGGLEFRVARRAWMYILVRYIDVATVDYFGEDLTLFPISFGLRF